MKSWWADLIVEKSDHKEHQLTVFIELDNDKHLSDHEVSQYISEKYGYKFVRFISVFPVGEPDRAPHRITSRGSFEEGEKQVKKDKKYDPIHRLVKGDASKGSKSSS